MSDFKKELKDEDLKQVSGGKVTYLGEDVFNGHLEIWLDAEHTKYFIMNDDENYGLTQIRGGKEYPTYIHGREYDLASDWPNDPFVVSYPPDILIKAYKQYGALD